MSTTRRTFLQTAAAAAGAVALGRAAPGEAELVATAAVQAAASAAELLKTPESKREGDMLYRTLGKTGEKVSLLGLGGFHIGNPPEAEGIKIIRNAIDAGVTFMDNCWDYHKGDSEVRMGKALQDGYRKKVFLMTKLDGRTRASAAKQIDESIQRLKTEVIDLMQIHENIRMEDADRCFAKGGCIEALEEARKAGKIRYVGFTGHKDPLVHLRMLEVAAKNHYRFDTCQMPLNVMDWHFRSFAHQVVPVLVREQMGVLGMKPMASGMILKSNTASATECLHFAMNLPTSVVITGIDSQKILAQALDAVKTFKPLTNEERAAITDKTRQAAANGEYELFKTNRMFDGTAQNPSWMG